MQLNTLFICKYLLMILLGVVLAAIGAACAVGAIFSLPLLILFPVFLVCMLLGLDLPFARSYLDFLETDNGLMIMAACFVVSFVIAFYIAAKSNHRELMEDFRSGEKRLKRLIRACPPIFRHRLKVILIFALSWVIIFLPIIIWWSDAYHAWIIGVIVAGLTIVCEGDSLKKAEHKEKVKLAYYFVARLAASKDFSSDSICGILLDMGAQRQGFVNESPVRGLLAIELSEALVAATTMLEEFSEKFEIICEVFGLSGVEAIYFTYQNIIDAKRLPRLKENFREDFDVKILNDLHVALGYSEDHLPVPTTA